MKAIMKYYFPGLTMIFTLVMVYRAVFGLFRENGPDGETLMVLQLLGYLIVTEAANWLVNQISFKTMTWYVITDYLVLYPILLIWGAVFGWFSFSVESVGTVTLLFTFVFALMQVYFYRLSKQEAAEINRLLQAKK